MKFEDRRLPAHTCLACGKSLDAITGDLTSEAKEGDVTVCIYCAAVMRLDKELVPGGFTPEQMEEVLRDREFMSEILKNVRAIRFVTASMN